MSAVVPALTPKVERDAGERSRRREYETTFREFARDLPPAVRAKINGSASPDWPSGRTFALAVNPDSPAFSTEAANPVLESLDELKRDFGAAAVRIAAAWVADNSEANEVVSLGAVDQLRRAVARICDAKNARLEAMVISLIIGLNLHGNANGYAIAEHFGLTAQTIHEMLAETAAALGMPKPLSKVNKKRYAATQHRHHIRRPARSA